MDFKPFYGLVPFFVSSLLALALALSYKAFKRRRDRRSPLASRQIGHVPGQQLVARVSDHEMDMIGSVGLMYMAFPLMFMLWAGTKIDWNAFRMGALEWLYVVGACAILGYGFGAYIRNLHARDRLRDGLLAERVTGMQLNRLAAQGCIVLHDLPAAGFNIDHVVVSPRAVYAVETKSFRKPKHARSDKTYKVGFDGSVLRFPDFIEKDAPEQAKRYATWLARALKDAGFDVPVVPALALPGWLIEQDVEVWRRATVKVFSPMGDGANFMAKDIVRVSPEQRKGISQALALRFPRLDS